MPAEPVAVSSAAPPATGAESTICGSDIALTLIASGGGEDTAARMRLRRGGPAFCSIGDPRRLEALDVDGAVEERGAVPRELDAVKLEPHAIACRRP